MPRRPSPALVIALIALFVALDGPAAAQRVAGQISGSRLRNNTVTGAKVRDATLATRDLSPRARAQLRVPGNGTVSAAKLRPNSVGAAAIAAGAVRSNELAAGAVDRGRLGDNAVDSGKVADGSLFARDVASAFGQTDRDFPALAPGQCAALPVNLPGSVNVADDVVVVSPPSNWPDLIPVTAKLGPGHQSITITACNGTGAAADPGAVNFRYVVFNQ